VRDRVGEMSLPWVMDYSPSLISIERGRVSGVGLPWVMDYQPSPTSVERGRVGGVFLPWQMDYSRSPSSIGRGRVDGVCLPQGIQDRRPTGKTRGRLETADRTAKRAAGRDKRNRLIRSTGSRETESF